MISDLNRAGWRGSVIFLAVALALVGGHIECANPLFDEAPLSFDPWSLVNFRLWMLMALLFGIVLPVLAALFSRGAERLAFAAVALWLVLQIILEVAVRPFDVPFAAELIGLLFTAWRLWQLARAYQLGCARWRRAGAIFAILFWSSNLALLLGTLAPRIG